MKLQNSETNLKTKITGRSINKAEINELPIIAWEGSIELLSTIESMEAAVKKLLQSEILGFDTETRPSFKKGEYYPPALVQLATKDTVYLFRISIVKTLAPLIPIFESADIIKAGVAIKDDVKELKAMEEFNAQGFVEITNLTTKLGYENRGLRPLAGIMMGGRISKAAQVSNWAKPELDLKQVRYAATDSWISRELYCLAVRECEQGSL